MLSREAALFINGPCGQLEALYQEVPDARGMVLICHPNPVQGGTMLNKVVSTLQRTARDAGFITLRFNYRGTGNSAGEHDMGQGEVDDAQAAMLWLKDRHPELALTLFGFSFGGFVAATLAGRLERQGLRLNHLFMLAPAVMRIKSTDDLPQDCPITVIQPETDEVVAPELVYDWCAALPRAYELLKVAECGHFFHGKLTELKELVLPRLVSER